MVAPIQGVRTRERKVTGRRSNGLRPWLTAGSVVRVCGGEVLRRGRTGTGISTDSRQDCTGRVFIALRGPNHDGHDHLYSAVQRGAVGLVVDRDVPLRLVPPGAFVAKVPDTGAALMALAAEHRQRSKARVVGITGSCGKTSTKEMIGAVLGRALPTVRSQGSHNNEIGVPLTLFQLNGDTLAAVVEIGTNAPGEIAMLTGIACPDIAVVTCVCPAHLQGLGSLDGVAQEKAALAMGVAKGGLVVLNGDDACCRAMADATPGRAVFVAVDRPADWFATDVRFAGMGTTFLLGGERPVTLPRLGTHNVYNALMTLAVAAEFGIDESQALEVLGTLPAVERRLECKRAGDVLLFDDTYNMNPASALAALRALAGLQGRGRRIAVFGEMLELGDQSVALHLDLGTAAQAAGVDLLLCVGAGAMPIAEGALGAGMPGDRVLQAFDPVQALEILSTELRPGDQVLCKASRRVGLDRLVDGLLLRLGVNEEEATS